jgi:hypothetical protein
MFDNSHRLRELVTELEMVTAQHIEQVEGWAQPPPPTSSPHAATTTTDDTSSPTADGTELSGQDTSIPT